MSNKLKKLASNISELIPESNTPQQVYDGLNNTLISQKDYFQYLGPHNIVKLIFYIYSFKTTGKFDVGDYMITSLGFANLFTSEGNTYEKECEVCYGDGDIDCEECDGKGEFQCEECEGDGEIVCTNCDGDGRQIINGEWEDCEECYGRGKVTCPNCGGDGANDCTSCSKGREKCWKCSGIGEVETNEIRYDAYFVVTWNRSINGDLSLNENTKYPALSEYEFDRLRDEFIILTFNDDGHAEFQDWVIINEMYCTFYSDEPKLKFTKKMRVDNRSDWSGPDYYTT
jgi:hypothetical protein